MGLLSVGLLSLGLPSSIRKKHTNLDIDGAYSTKATALEWPPISFNTFRVPRIEENGGDLVRRENPVPPNFGPWGTDYNKRK